MGAKQPKRWKNERNNEYKAHKKTRAKNRRYNMWLNAGGALWCASHHINNRHTHTQTHQNERKWAQSSPRGEKRSAKWRKSAQSGPVLGTYGSAEETEGDFFILFLALSDPSTGLQPPVGSSAAAT